MDNKNKQVDRSKLSIEQVAQLEQYEASQKQLAELGEITKKLQSVITVLNATQQKGEKDTNNLGSLLMDIRESIDELTSKEDPEAPDYAKPVVEAVSKLEKALTASIKAVDVKPQVNVAAPKVETKTDLSGVEKVLKSDVPKAFEKAIKSIPKVELPETDLSPLISQLKELGKKLADIDTGVRMKPTPGTMKVTNPDGSVIATNPLERATLYGTGNRGQLGILFSLDLLGYNTITVQCTSAGTATITYEASDDNTTWVAVPMDTLSATTTAPATTSTTVGVRGRSCTNRYFRARISSYTSGQVTAFYTATADTYMPTALSANLAGQTLPTVTTVGTVTNITNQGQLVDNAGFTDGTTRIMMNGYIYDEVAGTALTENDGAAARINANRAQVAVIEDGTTRARYATVTSGNALKVDPSGVTMPTTLVSFVTDIPTAGTRVQLGSNTMTNGFIIQAPSTNTGVIYVGGSTVSSTVYGAELQAGQSTSVMIDNTNKIYVDTNVSGSDVAVIGT